MKFTITILCILLFIITFVKAKYDVIKDGKNRYCGRKLDTKTGLLGYSASVTSTAACLGRARDETGFARASIINIGISSLFTPYFRFSFSKATFNSKSKTSLKHFFSQLFFIRVLEYEETNGVKGYQPGNDTIIKSYPLFKTDFQHLWSKIKYNYTEIAEGVRIHEVFMDLKKETDIVGNVKFGLKITPKEIKHSNGTKNVMILTPNSVKLDVEFTDIVYSSIKTTGLALEAGLLVRGGVVRRNKTRTFLAGEDDSERPDDVSDDQEVIEMNNEDESERAGFYSWKNWAFKNNGPTTVEVVNSKWDVRESNDLPGDGYAKSGYIINRVYFSIPERVSSFTWDPALGAIEDPDAGGAMKVAVSILLFAASILFTLIMS